MLTDAELIKRVEEIWATVPHPTRNVFKVKAGSSMPRLEQLAKDGLIKLPNRVPKNKCHLFSNQTKWRKFKLRGSPTLKDSK